MSDEIHNHFQISDATVERLLELAGAAAGGEQVASLKTLLSSVVRSAVVRWCVMRSYAGNSASLSARGEHDFGDLLATRFGFDRMEFTEVGDGVVADLADWLRSGGAVEGDWGRLALGEDGAILASLAEPVQFRTAGFAPATEE